LTARNSPLPTGTRLLVNEASARTSATKGAIDAAAGQRLNRLSCQVRGRNDSSWARSKASSSA
jgi:hypothetical protein